MSVMEALVAALGKPTPAGLYDLGGTLREQRLLAPAADAPALDLALDLCAGFYGFLSAVQAKTTAEEYNKVASLLDLGSVGTVALQNVLAEPEHRLRKLLMGGLSETLMMIGSVQYIKAWEREAQALHEQAAWRLYDALWTLSLRGQPELPPAERRRAVESLLAPCFDPTLKMPQQTVYVGWLYQLALVTALAGLGSPAGAS